MLTEANIRFRTGKALVPFRISGNASWGIPCPEIDGVSGLTKMCIRDRSGSAQQGVSTEPGGPAEQEMRVSSEDGTVVCRRVGLNGRSRVTIDGSLAGVKDLAAGVGASIDLCGQHEHQQLLNAAYQRKLFDRWGASSISPALERYHCLLYTSRCV